MEDRLEAELKYIRNVLDSPIGNTRKFILIKGLYEATAKHAGNCVAENAKLRKQLEKQTDDKTRDDLDKQEWRHDEDTHNIEDWLNGN